MLVVLIGDLHGNLDEALSLWERLGDRLGVEGLRRACVVFLGDYVDRGPDSCGTLEWLIGLREAREAEGSETHFLCGNHDFGMAAYLGCLPIDYACHDGFDFESTLDPNYVSGFWPHRIGGDGMHYQGRRWGGSSAYQSSVTFQSYGVEFTHTIEAREALIGAVPDSHKAFPSQLAWVFDESVPFAPGRLVAVHAGLTVGIESDAQIEALRARDLTATVLHEGGNTARLAAFHGRSAVRGMPTDLVDRALLVSGHHGIFSLDRDRIIIDASGGRPCRGRPIQALILPEREVVGSADEDAQDTRTTETKISTVGILPQQLLQQRQRLRRRSDDDPGRLVQETAPLGEGIDQSRQQL